MLNLFIRCIILYFFLLIAMRLMGKRQLGELQPFELAITLVASELACIPMADATIPIIYGIIPVFTLFLVHIIITKLATKSVRFRKVLNGKPVVVIENGNIVPKVLTELDMNIDDLMEALRGSGYFNPSEVEYAIIETNGSVTVLPKSQNKPLSPEDIGISLPPAELPVTVMMEGDFLGCNMVKVQGITKERILKMLERLQLKKEDVLVLLVAGTSVFVQPYDGDSLVAELSNDGDGTRIEVTDDTAENVEIYPTLNKQETRADGVKRDYTEEQRVWVSFNGDGAPVVRESAPENRLDSTFIQTEDDSNAPDLIDEDSNSDDVDEQSELQRDTKDANENSDRKGDDL